MRKFNPYISPYTAVIVSFLLTLVAWYFTQRSVKLYDATRFSAYSDEIEDNILSRLRTYMNVLVQTRTMFHVAKSVTRKQFQEYIESLNLLTEFPGVQGVGYIARIPREKLQSHIQDIRKEGFPNYQVWPPSHDPDVYSIVYLEPFDWRNQRAFGYDISTEPVRRAAMERARDTGLPIASNRIRLVQETNKDPQSGFSIYVPIYRAGMSTGTVEEKRKALSGFIYSPFRAKNLFESLFPRTQARLPIGFNIYLGDEHKSENLLYTYNHFNALDYNNYRPSFIRTVHVDLAGQKWILETFSLPSFQLPSSQLIPAAVAVTGMIVSFLLFLIMNNNLKHSRTEIARSMQLERLGRDERERASQLSTLNKIGRILSAELDLERLVQAITDAGRELSKAELGAFFYNILTPQGESYTLYTISGAKKEAFSHLPMPRNTAIFDSTFNGTDTVRSDDITKDPRYGKNVPYYGMPKGHPPIRSYLAVPVISRSGEVIGGLLYGHAQPGIFTDREERLVEGVATQAAVAMDNARLYQKSQEAIRSRDEFLSIASHELKTPLTSLKLQLQILVRHIMQGTITNLGPERLSKIATTSDKQIGRLANLIEDLLDVARISAGKLTLNREELDVCEIVKEVVERFRPQLTETHTPVSVETPGNMTGTFDRLRLEQIVVNLLSNAIKYAGGKPIKVQLTQAGNTFRLAVSDHGLGISQEDLPKVFERFERLGPDKKSASGLGLGLYITRQIVEAHGGNIRVESESGVGSTFFVSLPLTPAEKKEPESKDNKEQYA